MNNSSAVMSAFKTPPPESRACTLIPLFSRTGLLAKLYCPSKAREERKDLEVLACPMRVTRIKGFFFGEALRSTPAKEGDFFLVCKSETKGVEQDERVPKRVTVGYVNTRVAWSGCGSYEIRF